MINPDKESTRGRPPKLLNRVPTLVWLITGLWGALLLGASVVWPMTYGYDEAHHVDMAYVYSGNPFHFYAPGKLPVTYADYNLQHSLPGYPPKTRLADVPIPARSERPSLSQLGGRALTSGGQPNQMVQHPPLYYWMEAAVLRLPGMSGLAWDLQVWLMRTLSVALMLPLPVLCWATARRLLGLGENVGHPSEASPRFAVLAAALPLTVPNLVRDGSSVNNDTLLILSSSVVLYLLVKVMGGDRSYRTAVWMAVALAVALLTKGFALTLPPVILAGYLIGSDLAGSGLLGRIRACCRPLAVVAVGAVVGGLWWVRNVIDYGTVQPGGFGPGYNRVIFGPPDNHGTLVRFIPTYISLFIQRIWGGIGLPDTPSPGALVIYGWLVLVLTGWAIALSVRGRPWDRRRAALLTAVPVLFVLVDASGSWSSFKHWSAAVGAAQGRYIYPAIGAIAALTAVGWRRVLQPRFASRAAPWLILGAIVTNAVAWALVLRSWYQPKSGGSVSGARSAVDSLLRWSPLPEGLTVLFVFLLPAVFSVAVLVRAHSEARRHEAIPWLGMADADNIAMKDYDQDPQDQVIATGPRSSTLSVSPKHRRPQI